MSLSEGCMFSVMIGGLHRGLRDILTRRARPRMGPVGGL